MAIESTLLTDSRRGVFGLLLNMPLAIVERAIKTGNANKIFTSENYLRFQERLNQSIAKETGSQLNSSLGEVISGFPVELDNSIQNQIIADANAWSANYSRNLANGIDSKTKSAIRRLIRSAKSKKLKGRELRAEAIRIRAKFGSTIKQSRRIRDARIGGFSAIKARIRALSFEISNRVRPAIEGIAYRVAKQFKKIGKVVKRIVTKDDERVRERHDLQSKMKPVPLNSNFQLFDVGMTPLEFGCR